MATISEDTFNKLNHYVGVRLQQGVPLVDADWNEMEDIRKYELQSFIKWFVGNGVPINNNGFAITPPDGGEINDFLINRGDNTGADEGRCLVDGWEIRIEKDYLYTAQDLYIDPTLAAAWDVDPLPALSPPGTGERTDTVYLDSWERKLTTAEYQNDLYTLIGEDACIRLKREWVVRVAVGAASSELPAPPQGHVYYPLAELTRTSGKNAVEQDDLKDLRTTGLTLISQNNLRQVVTDAFGTSYGLDNDGNTKLILNLRETINALLNGTVPCTPPQQLTDDANGNKEPAALVDNNGTLRVFWHTIFGDKDIFHDRFIAGTLQGKEALTSGSASDESPAVLEDQNGTTWVFWHSDRDGQWSIYFDYLSNDAWKGNMPLSTVSADNMHPVALEDQNGNTWVFWISSQGAAHEIKYRKHSSSAPDNDSWEAEGTVTGGPLTISPGIYAAVEVSGDILVFWELPGAYHSSIYCRRYLSSTGTWEGGIEGTMLTSDQYGDSRPFALTDRGGVTWLFWSSYRDGSFKIYYKRCIGGTWLDETPLTTGTGSDESPFVMEDDNGNIWVFWRSDREGNWDIWYNRFTRGSWQGDRQLTTGTGEDENPFAVTDAEGHIQVFWQSKIDGLYNIWNSKIITRI